MHKTKIRTIEDGYDELFKDLFKTYGDNKLDLSYSDRDYTIEFTSVEEKEQFWKQLALFSIPQDVIDIIELRYGLHDGCARTLAELGRSLNITDEWVRNKVRTAHRKLRHRLNVSRAIDRYQMQRG